MAICTGRAHRHDHKCIVNPHGLRTRVGRYVGSSVGVLFDHSDSFDGASVGWSVGTLVGSNVSPGHSVGANVPAVC